MNRREFHFSEGSSDKFWAITVDGESFTVDFGRIGSKGQTQTKSFDSEAEARQAADKLIAEKTKKGYREVAATTTTAASTAKKSKVKAQPAKPSPEPETAAPTTPPAKLTIQRTIELEPRDWLWATWRPREQYLTPVPEPKPFDREECVERFRSTITIHPRGWTGWDRLRLDPSLSREEAHFWGVAVSGKIKSDPKKFVKQLESQTFDGQVSVEDVRAWFQEITAQSYYTMAFLWQIVPALLSAEEIVMLILDANFLGSHWNMAIHALEQFTEVIYPRSTRTQLESFKSLLRPHLHPAHWPTNPQARPLPFLAAAAIGMHDEMLKLVESWPDDVYAGTHFYAGQLEPQRIVFGLGSAQLVDYHFRRLKLRMDTPVSLRAWLAHTEYSGLDLARDAVLNAYNKDHSEQLLKVFCLVKAPEAAAPMLELKLTSKVSARARQWLDENQGHAIAGLIPVAGGRGKLADAALDYLRQAKEQGHSDFIEEQLKQATPEVAAKVRQEVLERVPAPRNPFDEAVTPKWLRNTLASGGLFPNPPQWAAPINLPPLLVGDQCLNDEQVRAVLSALRQSPLGAPAPLVKAIKENVDAASLDAFAWRVFELWLGEGAPSKEKWALLSVGHLGGDASVLKLTPLVRAWPGESQHQRAVVGLECLRAIGSDTALMQLNGVAQKLKFQGLKKKAQEFMEAIAKDRGMTRTQLEDRIVPDLDLDERGTRVFDFGPRQFTVVLDGDLKPVIRDDAGKLKSDLPKPGAKDDAAKANAALADWKILKKQLREAIKVQAYRLEQAMVVGRRWPVAEFESLLVRHPLMINLVRRLVWGGYDKKAKLTRTFRVTEERDYADEKDNRTTLDGLISIGIVHPVHLSEDQRSAWGQLFGDYEIIAPFPQLGRPVLALDATEMKASEIHRHQGVKIPATAFMGTMDKLGWTRGSADDHGVIMEFCKQFPAADVTALIENEDGIMLGLMDASGDQKIKRCFFLAEQYDPLSYPRHKDLQPLAKVDPVALSEVLADLATLASKGK
jgi:predicted DNA-binding WGR domain protein